MCVSWHFSPVYSLIRRRLPLQPGCVLRANLVKRSYEWTHRVESQERLNPHKQRFARYHLTIGARVHRSR